MNEWREATKREPCPVCGKPDWCSLAGPQGAIEAVVCMRIESSNLRPNGGWHHKLRESSGFSDSILDRKVTKTFDTASDALQVLKKKMGKPTAVWTYRTAAGDPVGVVARWDKDGDKEIRPISQCVGGWTIGAMKEPRPLYDLPAIAEVAGVFVTEGEKAADAIRSLGLAATTSSGGSAAAAKSDWSALAGKSVYLWPDNDVPGEKYANAVISELAKVFPAPKVFVVKPEGMPDKGDAADWLQAGGTAEALAKLVDEAQPARLIDAPIVKNGKRPLIKLADAAHQYIERLRGNEGLLVPTGIPELDSAIGGGLEFGEMVIFAARPSHGKSAVALQCAHNWTANDLPVLFVTEEMSASALGKRTLLFASNRPQEHWRTSLTDLAIDLNEFASERKDCYVIESCGTTENAVAEIRRAVNEHGVRAAVVDYAQLLASPGGSRYEQITNTSISLRKVASELKIVLLVLCQLNREIEARQSFQPKLSDLRDTGQLEQDADVIVFLVWPHRIDAKLPPHNYKFYIAKNRNREIAKSVVECRFEPSRQMMRAIETDEWNEPVEASYQPFKD